MHLTNVRDVDPDLCDKETGAIRNISLGSLDFNRSERHYTQPPGRPPGIPVQPAPNPPRGPPPW